MHTEGVPFDGLANLVPEEYAQHWQITLEFLKILTEIWPTILELEGAIDAAQRRNLVLKAQAEAWRANPPPGPVIAAGSTGTIPATADLLEVIAKLPQGCIVLPGLDQAMDEDSWAAASTDDGHPQHGLASLLTKLNCPATKSSHGNAAAGTRQPRPHQPDRRSHAPRGHDRGMAGARTHSMNRRSTASPGSTARPRRKRQPSSP